MSLYRTFFYVISENQLVKDQRNFKNIVKKKIHQFSCILLPCWHSYLIQTVVFVWTVVCSGIWSWNARLTNNITAFLWRAINEGITVLIQKMIYEVALILILCQREVDGRKKLYIFLNNDMSPLARKDVLWCFS